MAALGLGLGLINYAANAGALNKRDPNFTIRIDTTQAGSAADTFVLPWVGTYDVDWGDGNVDIAVTNTQTHVYASSGIYDVKVTAATGQIYFNNGGDKSKLIDIRNWGNIGWTSMERAFFGCNKLTNVTASDASDLSSVTNMSYMLANCSSLTNLDISAWDISSVTNMFFTFQGCSSLTALDVSSWNTSSVTNMFGMFYQCSSLTALDVSSWNTSSVTNMGVPFQGCSSLTTLDVSGWNTSSVVSMDSAFRFCSSLTNLDVSSWDIDQVTSFTSFAQNVTIPTATYDAILIAWAAQAPTSGLSIHFGNSKYSLIAIDARNTLVNTYNWTITDGGQTDTDKFIITIDTTEAGSAADTFVLPWVGTYDVDWGDGNVDTSVTDEQTHVYASSGIYDVKVTALTGRILFNNLGDKSKLIDIRNWGNVGWTSMALPFYGCNNLASVTAADVPNLSSVTAMIGAFYNCSSLTIFDVSSWNTSSVTNMGYAFRNCTSLTTLDVSSWDTSSVTQMYQTFQNCSSLTDLDVSLWDIDQVTSFTSFADVVTIPTATYDDILNNWESQLQTAYPDGVGYTPTISINFGSSQNSYLSYAAKRKLTTDKALGGFGWSITDSGQTDTAEFIITVKTDNAGTSSSDQFTLPWVGTYDVDWGDGSSDAGLSGTQTHTYPSVGTYDVKVTAATGQIRFNNTGDRSKLIDIRNWGNVGWTSMLYAFYGCDNLTNVTASDAPDLSSVTNMSIAFYGCSSLTDLDVSYWNTSSVTNMNATFRDCSSLTALNVSSWDTSSVTTMYQTFLNCSSLTTLDVSLWDTSSVTSMQSTFTFCSSLTTLDVSGWDTSSVTSVLNTFFSCSSLTTLDVSLWDTSSVTNMVSTFYGCTSLTNLDISAWDIDQVTNFTNFAVGVTIPTATYDATLIAWEAQAPTSGLSISFGNSKYTAGGAAEAARTSLQVTYGWTIVDGGPA